VGGLFGKRDLTPADEKERGESKCEGVTVSREWGMLEKARSRSRKTGYPRIVLGSLKG